MRGACRAFQGQNRPAAAGTPHLEWVSSVEPLFQATPESTPTSIHLRRASAAGVRRAGRHAQGYVKRKRVRAKATSESARLREDAAEALDSFAQLVRWEEAKREAQVAAAVGAGEVLRAGDVTHAGGLRLGQQRGGVAARGQCDPGEEAALGGGPLDAGWGVLLERGEHRVA